MLLSDPAAVAYYQDYLDVHVLLHWQQGLAEGQPACGGSGTGDEGPVAEGLSPLFPPAVAPFILHPSSFILCRPGVPCRQRRAFLSSRRGLLGAGILLAGAWHTGIDRSSLARAKAEAAKGTIRAPCSSPESRRPKTVTARMGGHGMPTAFSVGWVFSAM